MTYVRTYNTAFNSNQFFKRNKTKNYDTNNFKILINIKSSSKFLKGKP